MPDWLDKALGREKKKGPVTVKTEIGVPLAVIVQLHPADRKAVEAVTAAIDRNTAQMAKLTEAVGSGDEALRRENEQLRQQIKGAAETLDQEQGNIDKIGRD